MHYSAEYYLEQLQERDERIARLENDLACKRQEQWDDLQLIETLRLSRITAWLCFLSMLAYELWRVNQ